MMPKNDLLCFKQISDTKTCMLLLLLTNKIEEFQKGLHLQHVIDFSVPSYPLTVKIF